MASRNPYHSSVKAPWYRDGLRFTCTQCGLCCTGEPGYVWVNEDEITEIAHYLGVAREVFLKTHTRKAHRGTTLREKDNGDCVLYDRQVGCTVYPVRPRQCRTWPFWESNLRTPRDWQRTESICPGSGEGELIPVEEITRRIRLINM